MATEFKLPALGEKAKEGTVVSILVAVGDRVEQDQTVLELETDKAVVPVPSSVSGTVKDIQVKEGETVKVGATVFTLDAAASDTDSLAQPQAGQTPAAAQPASAQPAAPVAGTANGAVTAQPASEPAQPAAATSGPVEFRLPALGEKAKEGTVVGILVAVGDQLEKDQTVLELETDKAVIPVPSNVSGTVKEILVKEGETVKVNQPVLTVESASGATADGTKPSPSANGAAAAVRQSHRENRDEAEASTGMPSRAPVHSPPSPPQEGTLSPGAASSPVPGANGAITSTETAQQTITVKRDPAPASPSVRRLAREIGVDIYAVKGSGPAGRISEANVKAHAKKLLTAAPEARAVSAPSGMTAIELPDFAKWGAVERQPLSNVRRATAEHMHRSWSTVPHVTQFDKADITELEQLRKRFGKQVEAKGAKLTVTAIALKVVASALKRFPQFNASLDVASQEIILKKYYHVGVAVDTPRGLLVPVVRDVDKKNIVELSLELNQIAERARDKKTSLDEMQGGTFTITNLGGIGGTNFTPIVNAPEVAILGLARGGMEPAWIDGQFQPRLMLPLALSYDHRVIDGADGARFLRWIAQAMEQPFVLSLEG